MRGQGFVEMGLVLPVIMALILAAFDPFLFGVNLAVANIYSMQVAREASVYMAGDSQTCWQRAVAVVSSPPFINVASWTIDVAPCPNSLEFVSYTGTPVVSTLAFVYDAMFWPTVWNGQADAANIFQ